MDRLTCIKVFVRIARLGSMAAVARELDLSPPRISKYLNRLEGELGVQLIVRNTRNQYLTEVGRLCVGRWEKVLNDFEETQMMIAQQRDEPIGNLKINVPVSYGVLSLAELVVDFQRRYSNVSLSVTCSDVQVDLYEAGFDLAIRIAYQLEDSSMRARKLTTCQMVMSASPGYLEEFGIPESLKDFENHKCIVYSNLFNAENWEGEGPDGLESVSVKNSVVSNNGEFAMKLALHGSGIIFQPTFIVGPYIQSGELMRILPSYRFRHLNVYAVYPNKRHESVGVRLLIDYLVDELAKNNSWVA